MSRLEVCGASPRSLDKSATGERSHLLQGSLRFQDSHHSGLHVQKILTLFADQVSIQCLNNKCLFFFVFLWPVLVHALSVVYADPLSDPAEPQTEAERKEGDQGGVPEEHTVLSQ